MGQKVNKEKQDDRDLREQREKRVIKELMEQKVNVEK